MNSLCLKMIQFGFQHWAIRGFNYDLVKKKKNQLCIQPPISNEPGEITTWRATVNVQVIVTVPSGAWMQLGLSPELSTPPAHACLLWGHKQFPTVSGKHNNKSQYAGAHYKNMAPSAVTTNHAETKEDPAQMLCKWCNNAQTDMIGYFLSARGQTQGR